MPKILGQDEQQRALKEIRSTLKELSGVNQFLEADNKDGIYTISFTDPSGATFKAELFSESKDDIDLLVMNHKERVKNHIIELAKNNRIALDPEDNEILGIRDND